MSYPILFSPDIKSIIVRFKCKHCDTLIESQEISVPCPTLSEDDSSKPYEKNEGIAICSKCNNDFDVDIYSKNLDGYIEIFDIDDKSISYEEILDENVFQEYLDEQIDAIVRSINYIEQFEIELANLRKLNKLKLDDISLQKTLQKQIYSGTIACLEDYLSNTLIKKILQNQANFKNFVLSYKNFKDRKFDLNEIYTKLDSIEETVKRELVDIIYHDLRKVRGIYQDTLKIQFPAISELILIINKRHDIVHRNGKDKNGENIDISEAMVSDAINNVYSFVKEIEDKIELKEFNEIEF